jgi:NhaA family Na+:H+ antiporter
VQATIAGVALGLLTPAGKVGGRDVLATLEHRLHPWSAFFVVPLFALADAGVNFGGGLLREAATTAAPWAIMLGPVVGKLVGISAAVWLAVRTALGGLPRRWVRCTCRRSLPWRGSGSPFPCSSLTAPMRTGS